MGSSAQLQDLLFHGESDASARDFRALSACILCLLYLAGLAHWYAFLNYGLINFNLMDWTPHYWFYVPLQEAVRTLRFPYYTSHPIWGDFHGLLTYPIASISPQILLLRFLSINAYMVVNVLFFYTLGFTGCLLIKRKYRLSLFVFAILFLVVNYNGHVLSHLAVGHPEWVTFFLLPAIFYLILDWGGKGYSRRHALLSAMVLFFMFLNGGLHFFAQSLLFLFFYVLFQMKWQALRFFAVAAGMAIFLSAVRILPAAPFYHSLDAGFCLGYETPLSIVEAMTAMRDFNYAQKGWQTLGQMNFVGCWWEYNIYITFIGFLFLAYFGIYLRLRSRRPSDMPVFREWDWPMLAMTVLALGHGYLIVRNLGIPFLSNLERVPSRFLIFPVLMLTIIACVRFQYFLSRDLVGPRGKMGAVLALVYAACLLKLHASKWQLSRWPKELATGDITLRPVLVEMHNALYEHAVTVGLAATGIALVLWVYLFWKNKDLDLWTGK